MKVKFHPFSELNNNKTHPSDFISGLCVHFFNYLWKCDLIRKVLLPPEHSLIYKEKRRFIELTSWCGI